MVNVLVDEIEMVYKLIRTRTTPVSQLTRHTDTLVGSTVEKFARYFPWNRQVHQLAREVKLG